MVNSDTLLSELDEYASNSMIQDIPPDLIASSLEPLKLLEGRLKNTSDKSKLERYENVLKAVLQAICTPDLLGKDAREIAQFQQRVGFLYKFKSYTIKAVSPLGYSIFLHEPKQGFSFQIHKEHKVEVFHILQVMPGGYVFLCTYEDWKKTYDEESFSQWLQGADVPKYDPFKFVPSPGDVFVVDDLNVVHTVIGCTLEEFANVSTDMVDRLYDQNQGKPIPENYTRENADKKLREVVPTTPKRLLDFRKKWDAEPLKSENLNGAVKTTIVEMSFTAINYIFPANYSSEQMTDLTRHIALHVWRGEGEIIIGDQNEWKSGTPPAIKISKGDLLFIPANQIYTIKNLSSSTLEVTEHHIAGDEAFIHAH